MTTIPSGGTSSVDTSYQAEQAAASPPGVDLDGNGMLDPYEQQQAAVSLAPVLYYAPGEENFPADPITFTEQSSLREERDWRGDKERYGPRVLRLQRRPARTGRRAEPRRRLGAHHHPAGRPVPSTEVRYSAHSGLDISCAWPGADNSSGQPVAALENGKPVVFVGQGSHANFPETGNWETQAEASTTWLPTMRKTACASTWPRWKRVT